MPFVSVMGRYSLKNATKLVTVLVLINCMVGLAYGRSIPTTTTDRQDHEEWLYSIRLHGFLMYLSMCLLHPAGIIVIRLMRNAENGLSENQLKAFFCTHILFQLLGVAVLTTAAVFSYKKFNFNTSHGHQRLGWGLWIAVWLQFILGLIRPHRGMRIRSIWYSVHWILGTTILILGFINTFIGLELYEKIAEDNVQLLSILFFIQISVAALVFLMQDRWYYMIEQGRRLDVPRANDMSLEYPASGYL